MFEAVDILSVSRTWYDGVVYNFELESNDPQADDLFWVEGATGVVNHNCLPKDLLCWIDCVRTTDGPDLPAEHPFVSNAAANTNYSRRPDAYPSPQDRPEGSR